MRELLKELEGEIENRHIPAEEVSKIISSIPHLTNRRIIMGYASVAMVDRENQKISISALREAVKRFMADDRYRIISIFHCLDPETEILCCKKGNKYLPIREIEVGDKVYSHTGVLRKVNEVFKYPVNGLVYKIALSNQTELIITGEHPVLTKYRGWVKAKDLLEGEILMHCSPSSLKKAAQTIGCIRKDLTIEEIYGVERANKIREAVSRANSGRPSCHKGLTSEEEYGKEKAREIGEKISQNRKGKGTGKRDHYTLSDEHNSQQRKGHTWEEVYGHKKPNYGGNSGPNNPMWRDGISALPYSFDFGKKKNIIKMRDGYTCQLCGKEIKEYSRKVFITVHHIDYDKKNSSDQNLIALCNSCNSKVNYDRNTWEAFFRDKMEKKFQLANGTKIVSIKKVWYTGVVYNLDVDTDHTYAGRGVIFHNSDACVGRVLPKWTDPNTGKVYNTEVDNVGWKVIVELRDDIELANKVWDEIIKGNLRSFSVAGTSKQKHHTVTGGTPYTEIDELDLLECTICLPGDEKIWTKRDLVSIKDVSTDDFVFTHKGRWKKVIKVMKREVDEELLKIITADGSLTATTEHPVRAIRYHGCDEGTKYEWVPAKELKIGDTVSTHIQKSTCLCCGSPIFKGSHSCKGGKFCSKECQYKMPNRKGKTIASGDPGAISQSNKLRGVTKKDNPNLTGGVRTEEGKIKQQLSKKTPEFRAKRSKVQKELWKDPTYSKVQRNKINQVLRSPENRQKSSIRFKAMWQDEKTIEKIHKSWSIKPNKIEIELENFLNENFPSEWKYVGDGQVWLGTKNPDYINVNGQKKIIELNGEFWHQDAEATENRTKYFRNFGFETLIITDKEFISSKEECLDRIKEFCGNKLSKIAEIEKIHYKGLVYNLEVEDDNSYTTSSIVVHNCSIPVNPMSMFSIMYDPQEAKI